MNRKNITIIGGAVVLGIIVFFVLLRQPDVAPEPAIDHTIKVIGPPPLESVVATAAERRFVDLEPPAPPATPALDEEDDYPEPAIVESDEFQPENVEFAAQSVILDLGEYEVRTGEEFDLYLSLSAPALASLLLVLEFDAELLEYVPDSAEAVGDVFRNDIEFHEDPKGGRVALINGGLPGNKNTNAAHHDRAASFRMRALKPGEVTLTPASNGISFGNALGGTLEYEVHGGLVSIY